MKVQKSQLQVVISKMVKEELRKLLPQLVEEFLTEKYIRTLAESNRSHPVPRPVVVEKNGKGTKRGSLADMLSYDGDAPEDDDVPEPPDNDHEGIYQGKSRVETDLGERRTLSPAREELMRVRAELLSESNPMREIYEDVRPLPAASAAPSMSGDEGIPLNKMPGFNPEKMKAMMEGMTRKAVVTSPVSSHEAEQRLKMEEERLKRQREELNSRVVSTPKVV